jgi:hypothetical protein
MNWKDSDLPALRELESVILNVWRQHEAMNDYTAGRAYDTAYQHFRARLRGREPKPVALAGTDLDAFKALHEVCERLLTSGPAPLKGLADGKSSPVTVEKLVEYLRELNRSVQRHTKTGGQHGYLKFIRDFVA